MIIQNDFFAITDVVLCDKKTAKKDYHLQIKCRKNHGLTLVLSGELTFSFADSVITAKPGDIVLQEKGDAYHLHNLGETAEYIVISYHCTPVEMVSRLAASGKVFHSKHASRYIDRFNKATEVSRSSGPCVKPLLIAITQQLICNIIQENAAQIETAVNNPATVAKMYIDENACTTISIQDVANHIGFSTSHLRQIFKQEYGIPPVRYLNTVRVQRAKDLLSSGFYTMQEISTACGFSNVYYFSRVFKEFTGISPGSY